MKGGEGYMFFTELELAKTLCAFAQYDDMPTDYADVERAWKRTPLKKFYRKDARALMAVFMSGRKIRPCPSDASPGAKK